MEVETLAELANHVGQRVEPSDWVLIDQKMVDAFADVTGDHNWFHVDVERASRELPGGTTMAHGMLTLSLVPGLAAGMLTIGDQRRTLNYGLNKVRFPAPVPVGSRVRLHMTIAGVEKAHGGVLVRRDYTMELEGAEKPVMVAEMLSLVYA
ncbi:MAG: MaoC family dehydratase [Aquisalimonadaceae bacterium]